jgi:regulator of sigma E protease
MLGILVTIHELGHFIMAKAFKVYCFEFSIGFGPKIFSKRKGETYYSLRALPIGGYVSMYGETDVVPKEFENEEIDESRSLLKVHKGKRVAIMSAGVIMNFIIGLLIFFISNVAVKQTQLLTTLEINTAERAYTEYNLESGDRFNFKIVKVGSDSIQIFGEGTLSDAPGKEFYVLFQPESYADLSFGGKGIILLDKTTTNLYTANLDFPLGSASILTFDAEFTRGEGESATIFSKTLQFSTVQIDELDARKGYKFENIGISFTKRQYYNTFGNAVKYTFEDFGRSFTAIGRGLASLFQKGVFNNLSGFVGIYNQTNATLTNYGVGQYLFIWGLISVNLGIFNLLPFPGLDGWHILITIIEAIIRREVNPKFKQIATAIGLVLLFGLMAAVTIRELFFVLI